MHIKTLTVDLNNRSYPIFIGEDLTNQIDISPYVKGQQVCIVTSTTIAPLYLSKIQSYFAQYDLCHCIIDDGEASKSLESAQQIYTTLIDRAFSRSATLVALGGGVVGDLTGFAAATWLRGVPFIQIPTTLLAQVDSSVGGKTGVNHAKAKNMIGAFHQPCAVLADTLMLNTLSPEQFKSGLAEIIKYGLIYDADFFEWLEQNLDQLLDKQPDALHYAIEKSCQIKADIVEKDEYESNVRALLNFGHTFGHAIEAHLGYGEWLHGEAISAGMTMAAHLSQKMGQLSAEDLDRVRQILQRAGLPILGPANMSFEDYLDKMRVDKKVHNNIIRLVLLNVIGSAYVSEDYHASDLQTVIQQNSP